MLVSKGLGSLGEQTFEVLLARYLFVHLAFLRSHVFTLYRHKIVGGGDNMHWIHTWVRTWVHIQVLTAYLSYSGYDP